MKSAYLGALALVATCTLSSCATSSAQYNGVAGNYGEATPGILYTPDYRYYTRADGYPANTGGSYYTYGGRYYGGGYGYGAPFNH